MSTDLKFDPSTFAYGWRQDIENHRELMRTQQRFDLSHFASYRIPREVDQRPRVLIEDQDGIGACSGFSRATCESILNGIATKWTDGWVRLSQNYAYITNQMCCGCEGGDKGATISGSIQASKQYGICRYELFPFRKVYDPNIPQRARQEAIKHPTGSHSVISSFQYAHQYLGTVGVIQIGMPVGQAFQSCRGILTERMVRADALKPGGGHALAIIGYVLAKTINAPDRGRPYLIGVNSWTKQWGDNGFFYIEPEAFDYLMSLMGHGEVECIGMSRIQAFDRGDQHSLIDMDDDAVLV